MKRRNLNTERLLVNLQPSIKKEAAKRTETNMNDEIVAVLCARLGIPFTPSGYRSEPSALKLAGGKTLLRVPKKLKRAIVQRAVRNETNQTIEVNSILADEYGITYEPLSGTRAPVGGGGRRRSAAHA